MSVYETYGLLPERLEKVFDDLWAAGNWPSKNYTKVPPTSLVLELFSERHALAFLIRAKIVKDRQGEICKEKEKSGRPCGGTMNLEENGDSWRFRCCKSKCRHEISVFENTIFEGCKMKTSQVLTLCYYWLGEMTSSQMVTFLGVSPSTVMDWRKFIEEVVAAAQVNDPDGEKIGGPNVIVEIDETKMAKRKYNRGHRVGDKSWVIAAVEQTTKRFVAAVPVWNRTRETCTWFINKYVNPGSIVWTDCWKGYNTADIHNITGVPLDQCHRTVNHSIEYVAPDGTHINTIEGTNHAMKMKIPRRLRGYDNIRDPLLVFCWRRRNADCLWRKFWTALADVKYIEEDPNLPANFYEQYAEDDEGDDHDQDAAPEEEDEYYEKYGEVGKENKEDSPQRKKRRTGEISSSSASAK